MTFRLIVARLGRISRDLSESSRIGEIGINEIAKQVHMSAAALKRRLSEERTTHTKIADEVRREYALPCLADRRIPIGDIAQRFGFSSASAFGKAF